MRPFLPALLGALVTLLTATPAAAHTGFDPDEAGPGMIAAVTLHLADERDDAAIVKAELFVPEGHVIDVVPVAQPAGWRATTVADRTVWEGPGTDGAVQLRMLLGPLPAAPQRLQFKVLQTYDDGEVDRWIEEWPEGAAEPAMPGPILTLAPGAPGTVPDPAATTTTAPTTAAPTTVVDDPVVAPASTTTVVDADATGGSAGDSTAGDSTAGDTPDGPGDDDGSDVGVPIAVGLALLVLGGIAAVLARRSRT